MSRSRDISGDTRKEVQYFLTYLFDDLHWINKALAAPPGGTDHNGLVMVGRAVVELIYIGNLLNTPNVASDSEFDRNKVVKLMGKRIQESNLPKYIALDGDFVISDLEQKDFENYGMCLLAAVYFDSGRSVSEVEACLRALGIGRLPSLRTY